MKSKRQAVKAAQQQQKKVSTIIAIAGVALLAIVIGYFIVSSATNPATSAAVTGEVLPLESIAPTGANDHMKDGEDPGQYSSNPPSSGHHYQDWAKPGFYDENIYEKFPEGHLVHNLEHGYIIFWYNCKILSATECTDLKTQIKGVMSATENFKMIAYPWEAIDVPVVMTSWGFKQPFKKFDSAVAKNFVLDHRNRAPEPNAP